MSEGPSREQRWRLMDREIRSLRFPNTQTLARALRVSPRSVRRDLERLRIELRAPLEFDPTRNGFRYTDPAFVLPRRLARSAARPADATPIEDLDESTVPPRANELAPCSARITFAAHLATQIEPPNGVIKAHIQVRTDGAVEATIETSDVDVLLAWIFSFGTSAEVTSPPWLRRRARELLSRMTRLYSSERKQRR